VTSQKLGTIKDSPGGIIANGEDILKKVSTQHLGFSINELFKQSCPSGLMYSNFTSLKDNFDS